MKKFACGAAAAFGVMAGSAMAGEELDCAAQYSLEDHVLLEWAAFGGDPHSQMALAQCSFPTTLDAAAASAMTPTQRIYAIRWNTIALCEAEQSAAHDRRDQRLRALKEDANISFRRFGGLAKSEKMNWRERDFIEYRKEQTALLADRHARLMQSASAVELGEARGEIAEQLSRMGQVGLIKLAEISSCAAFGASPAFEAAAWSAASEAWRGAEHAGVYAAAESEDYDLPKIALAKTKALSGADRRVASLEKERLLRTDPKRLVALEQKAGKFEETAAVERLANFSLPARRADAGLADAPQAQPSLTTALQFALESLGYVNFINGPDNDYGPTTKAAVARMQASGGGEPTMHLTNAEVRDVVCKAAAKNDPVSLYHVALMYKNGWGFRQDDAKAASAISKSETSMIAALGGAELPAWKREAYKTYAGKIRVAAHDMKKPETSAGDAPVCD